MTEDIIDNIEVFKQNHIRINSGGKEIHFDPFRTDNAPGNADFIFITHDHSDHFSPGDIERTACGNTVLIVPEKMLSKAAAVESFVGKIAAVRPGETYDIDGLEFETLPAYNIGKPFHPKNAGWVGYVLKTGGGRIYVAGDTDATEEAKAVRCDIALIPIGGTFTMNPKQAAELVNEIKPGIAVPVHYGSIVGKEKDGSEFEKRVDKDVKVVFKIRFGQ